MAFYLVCPGASGYVSAVTPGWECIPAVAGEAVLSGGTKSVPSCASGSTAVLAPTYVSSGVGGKPTVQFASVNVQILDGAGSTGSTNGSGNLVIGYDESPGKQTGSLNLVLGQQQSFTSYGGVIGGYHNHVTGPWSAAFGAANKAAGAYSLAAGGNNTASGPYSSSLGGTQNTASAASSSVTGGIDNRPPTGTARSPGVREPDRAGDSAEPPVRPRRRVDQRRLSEPGAGRG